MASDASAVRQVYKLDFENLTTSTTPLSEIKEVFIYPNPASSVLRLSGWGRIQSIEIYNTAGTCVLKAMAEPKIMIDQLPNDIYYLKVVNHRGRSPDLLPLSRQIKKKEAGLTVEPASVLLRWNYSQFLNFSLLYQNSSFFPCFSLKGLHQIH